MRRTSHSSAGTPAPRLARPRSWGPACPTPLARARLIISGGPMPSSSRRHFLGARKLAVPAGALAVRGVGAAAFAGRAVAGGPPPVPMLFPTQVPELVQEMVVVAHGNVAR